MLYFYIKDNLFNGISNQRIFDEVKSDKKATGECNVRKRTKSFCGIAVVSRCNTCFQIVLYVTRRLRNLKWGR